MVMSIEQYIQRPRPSRRMGVGSMSMYVLCRCPSQCNSGWPSVLRGKTAKIAGPRWERFVIDQEY